MPDHTSQLKTPWVTPNCVATVRAWGENSLKIEGGEVVVYGYDHETRDVRFSGTPAEAQAFKAGAIDLGNVLHGWMEMQNA